MKKIYTIVVVLFLSAIVFAQAPQKMSYQAVIRDASNNLVTSHSVGMKISILQGSATGTAVYSETLSQTTNANGLVSIEFGGGTGFSSIDWSTGSYFIQTETDPTGGTNYTITGTSQLLSVPYALYAKTAGSSIANLKGDKGDQGIQGIAGINGLSAYELWKTIVGNESKTEADFFASLKGAQGISSDSILTAPNGTKYKLQVANDGTISTVLASQTIPVVVTTVLSTITSTTANSGGTISSDGGATITARGICWSLTANPTILNSKTIDGSGTGSFISSLTGLTANTSYYVRAYATNSKGTAYGMQEIFTTIETPPLSTVTFGSMTDGENNIYKTVTIGTQVWMAENLKVTKYNDGTTIPNVTSATIWIGLTTGAQCAYNNIASNTTTYGRLYNWYAVNTAKLCPTNWHVPSEAEWNTLFITIGGNSTSGGALKETGTTHWTSPNTGATNITGFTALPGGGRGTNGTFDLIGSIGYWWSSTSHGINTAVQRYMSYNNSYIENSYWFNYDGISVRCLKD